MHLGGNLLEQLVTRPRPQHNYVDVMSKALDPCISIAPFHVGGEAVGIEMKELPNELYYCIAPIKNGNIYLSGALRNKFGWCV